jgi:hypothetical protein
MSSSAYTLHVLAASVKRDLCTGALTTHGMSASRALFETDCTDELLFVCMCVVLLVSGSACVLQPVQVPVRPAAGPVHATAAGTGADQCRRQVCSHNMLRRLLMLPRYVWVQGVSCSGAHGAGVLTAS